MALWHNKPYYSKKTLTIPNVLRFEFFTTLNVGSQTTLKVGKIWASEITSKLVLENARLEYATTGTYSFFFNRTYIGGPHQGTLLIKGQSQIITQPGIELFFNPLSSLEFDTGSLLTINPGTKFTIG